MPARTTGDRRETTAKLNTMFSIRRHPEGGTNQAKDLRVIREAARDFAELIMDHTPRCADQTTAIRTVREAVLWAHEAIYTEGAV